MLKVQDRQCETCIYRKTSTLDIKSLEAQIADPYMEGFFKGSRICHHSKDAVCRGFWNRHKDHFTAGQLAQRLHFVEFVRHDILTERAAKAFTTKGKKKR